MLLAVHRQFNICISEKTCNNVKELLVITLGWTNSGLARQQGVHPSPLGFLQWSRQLL